MRLRVGESVIMPGDFRGIIWAHSEKDARGKAAAAFGMGNELPIVDGFGPAPKAYAVWGSGVMGYIPSPPTGGETPPPGGTGAPPVILTIGGETPPAAAGGAPPVILQIGAGDGEYTQQTPTTQINPQLQQAMEGTPPASIDVTIL